MLTSLIYYYITFKRRHEFRERAKRFDEITVWNRRDAEALSREWAKFELGALGLWGIFFALEVGTMFSILGTLLKP